MLSAHEAWAWSIGVIGVTACVCWMLRGIFTGPSKVESNGYSSSGWTLPEYPEHTWSSRETNITIKIPKYDIDTVDDAREILGKIQDKINECRDQPISAEYQELWTDIWKYFDEISNDQHEPEADSGSGRTNDRNNDDVHKGQANV